MFSLESKFDRAYDRMGTNSKSNKQVSSVPKAQPDTDTAQIQKMIDNSIQGLVEEQRHLQKLQLEIKTLNKKHKDELTKVHQECSSIKSKLKLQNRVFEKIRLNSLRTHSVKAAVRHRELEYYTKRDFFQFMRKLRESFEIVMQLLKEAFKRDQKIANNLFESHFHPSGKGLTVATQCH